MKETITVDFLLYHPTHDLLRFAMQYNLSENTIRKVNRKTNLLPKNCVNDAYYSIEVNISPESLGKLFVLPEHRGDWT